MNSRDNRQRRIDPAESEAFEIVMDTIRLAEADVVLNLSSSGTILGASGNRGLADWVGSRLPDRMTPEDATAVADAMKQALATDEASDRFQISIAVEGRAQVTMSASVVPGNGPVTSLVLRDLEPMVEAVERADRLQAALEAQDSQSRAAEGVQRALMAHLNEAVVLVDVSSGRILDLSHPAAQILAPMGEGQVTGLVGGAFTQCFEGRRRSEFIDGLCVAATATSAKPIPVDLRGRRGRIGIVPRDAQAAGTRLLVCRLVSDDVEGARTTWTGLGLLGETTTDGMICVDVRGHLLEANPGFVRMVAGGSSDAVVGRPLASFLLRGLVDARALFDPERPRCLTTQVIGLTGQRLPVEITVTELPDGGFGLILRDISLASVVRPKADVETDSRAVEAAGLVGTMPLRDIVASKTEEIERECIIAAIELTQNNRVACAEMLGLSRQSLYVKLRKFGLLDKDDM